MFVIFKDDIKNSVYRLNLNSNNTIVYFIVKYLYFIEKYTKKTNRYLFLGSYSLLVGLGDSGENLFYFTSLPS